MWFVFLNYRFKLIFHLEIPGHLFLALLQIFLPFPLALTAVSFPSQLCGYSRNETAQKDELSYNSIQLPPQRFKVQTPTISGGLWSASIRLLLSPHHQPQAMQKLQNSFQQASVNWPHCHLVLWIIQKNVQSLRWVPTGACCPDWHGKGSAGQGEQGAVKGKSDATFSCTTILLTLA